MGIESRSFSALSQRECETLLTSQQVGRVVYTSGALPAAAPVNYALHQGDIVFRTAPGSKLEAATRQAVVAFEVDQIDPVTRSGWSVLVVGQASHETDRGVIAELDRLGLDTWLPEPPDRYVRIRAQQLTGRVLDGRRPPPPW